MGKPQAASYTLQAKDKAPGKQGGSKLQAASYKRKAGTWNAMKPHAASTSRGKQKGEGQPIGNKALRQA